MVLYKKKYAGVWLEREVQVQPVKQPTKSSHTILITNLTGKKFLTMSSLSVYTVPYYTFFFFMNIFLFSLVDKK